MNSSRKIPRPLLVTYLRSHIPMYTRRYARIDTAIPRFVQKLVLEGRPGDVVEIAHADHGFQIATIKIGVGPRIDIKWTIAA